jgi:hypothetical protein
VTSDNAFAYRKSNAFPALLDTHGARHILTPPWNGKVERFIQTLKREWAYAHYNVRGVGQLVPKMAICGDGLISPAEPRGPLAGDSLRSG